MPLTESLDHPEAVKDDLDRIVCLTARALRGAAFASISCVVDDTPRTFSSTDTEVLELDHAQYRVAAGPCLDAMHTGTVCRVDAVRSTERWPTFVDACLAHGIQSALSVPLSTHDRTWGAMNVYADAEHSFPDPQVEVAVLLAEHAASIVRHVMACEDAQRQVEQLTESRASRGVIEQAKGIIIAALRCSADDAFDVLVRRSQHENRKLRTVAVDIVTAASRQSAT